MKNVYQIGSGDLTFDIIERIINENLKLELAPEAKDRIQKCRELPGQKDQGIRCPSLWHHDRIRQPVQP